MGCGISSESKTEVTSLWSDRQSSRVTVIQILRHDMRELFGMEVIDQWGFFMDMNMSRIINDFFAFYPRGHRVLQGHTSDVWSAVVSSGGTHLFTGSEDRTIIKWDLFTFEQSSRFHAHRGTVYCLVHSSRMLVSGGQDKMIRIWDDSTLRLIHEWKGHEKAVGSLDLDNERGLLLSGSWDCTVKIWSVHSWEPVMVFTKHTSNARRVVFVGDFVMSASYDGCIRVWIPQSGEEKKTSDLQMDASLFDLSINCDATIVAVVHHHLTLLHWPDLRPFRFIRAQSMEDCAFCVAFHPFDPNIVAYDRGSTQPRIGLYHIQSRKSIGMESDILGRGPHHTSQIHFNNEGSRLITVSFDHTTRVWDVADELESLKN